MIFLVLFIAIAYLGVIGLGLFALWLARQLATGRRLHYIRNHSGKPLLHPALIAKEYAAMLAIIGSCILLLALAVPVCGLPWALLPSGVALVAPTVAIWRHALLIRYNRRADALSEKP